MHDGSSNVNISALKLDPDKLAFDLFEWQATEPPDVGLPVEDIIDSLSWGHVVSCRFRGSASHFDLILIN